MNQTTSLRIVAWLIAFVLIAGTLAAQPLPQSVLILDQYAGSLPWVAARNAAFRTSLNKGRTVPISIYEEYLDFNRFSAPKYKESLKLHFGEKYRDKPVGLIVAFGPLALEYAVDIRANLWPKTAVVFGEIAETAISRSGLPAGVTGTTINITFGELLIAARAVVPDLAHIAIVGDLLDNLPAYRHFKEEIPIVSRDLDLIDLTGLAMEDLRKRLAVLPDRTAIIYTTINLDRAGVSYVPAEALSLVAEVANRPIVISTETFLGRGAVGGFLVTPATVGEDAARLALRILKGEDASTIAAATEPTNKPIFDWRQLRRWGISESALPLGSEIRFRELSTWEQYRWQISATAAVLGLQAAMIMGLLYEHRRRRTAEIEARQRLSELAHLNRHATAGELSASIAHELNQPLGAILNNTESASVILSSPAPDLKEIKTIVDEIRRDDQRATEVIRRLRRLLGKSAIEAQDIDLNETVREVFEILSVQAAARDVTLSSRLAQAPLRVSGDRIQLQQVILNLVVNGMDAMAGAANGRREVTSSTSVDQASAKISIADSGPGVPSDKLKAIFEPFFTTKDDGMGMGLSIARTIVEAHGGRIWAENHTAGGAVFHVSLPLAKAS